MHNKQERKGDKKGITGAGMNPASVLSKWLSWDFLLAHGSDDGFAAISGNPAILTGLYRLTHHISGPARKREITSRRDITVVLVIGRGLCKRTEYCYIFKIAKRKAKVNMRNAVCKAHINVTCSLVRGIRVMPPSFSRRAELS